MKAVLLTLFTICVAYTSNAQFTLDHYHPLKIIEELQIDSCSLFVMNEDSSLRLQQSYIYNRKGQETENRRYFQSFSYMYSYDSKGRVLTSKYAPFDEKSWEMDTMIYNNKGQLVKSITTDHDGKETKRHEYSYKRKHLVLEKYILFGNLHVVSDYSYKKRTNEKIVNRTFRGEPQGSWVYKYNDEGELISFSIFDTKGKRTSTQIFKYSAEGYKLEQRIFDDMNLLSMVCTTKYDSKGLIEYQESWTSLKDGQLASGSYSKTIYKYR